MVYLFGDKGLFDVFVYGKDIYWVMVFEVFNVVEDDVIDNQCCSVKVINFGLIYGMFVFGLVKQLYVGCQEVQEYMDLYFKCYLGVFDYMDCICDFVKEYGYVEIVFGWWLYLLEIKLSNGVCCKGVEWVVINVFMQGMVVDVIKMVMIQVDDWICSIDSDDVVMIMQVYDELVFEIKQDILDINVVIIVELMEQVVILLVLLKVEVGNGENWEEVY